MSEQEWVSAIAESLIGKRVTGVRYMTEAEAEVNLWYNRSVVIMFDDGSYIIPMSDDEGNNGGALASSDNKLPVIPVM